MSLGIGLSQKLVRIHNNLMHVFLAYADTHRPRCLHQESPCESRSTGDDPNPDSNEESNESTEYESPDSSENDSEETTPSHPRGTVLNSTPDGARLLHEITCCPMPRVQYGRPRRLLVPPITEIPMVAATMRADLQHIDEKG